MTYKVLKFGGAALSTPSHFAKIARIIMQKQVDEVGLVVVLSAMGSLTNKLLNLAGQVNPEPPKRELDMLVSVGERISISLLAMALDKEGQAAVSFTGSQSGIVTNEAHSQALIVDVKPFRVKEVLDQGKVAIVAGFQGVSQACEITTLGRGGSDTTAVALATALGAPTVEFFKDVGGVYSEDPKKNPSAEMYSHLTYAQTLRILDVTPQILHNRAVMLAQKNSIELKIKSFNDPGNEGTRIYDPSQSKPKNCSYEIQEVAHA